MRAIVILLSSFALLQCCFSQDLNGSKDYVIAITNVSVITMKDGMVLSDKTVILKNGLISAVIPSKKFKPEVGAVIINGKNQYLMPGLIDVHIHLEPDNNALNRQLCSSLLTYGITTALALNGDTTQLKLRDSIASGLVYGPRLLVSSAKMNNSEFSEEEGRQFVREAKEAGFDFIKVYSNLSKDGLIGALSEAKKLNIPVTGHVPNHAGLVNTLNAGLTRIAHAEELLYNEPFFFKVLQDTIPVKVLNPNKIPLVIGWLKEHKVMLSPTLSSFETIIFTTKKPEELKKQAQNYHPKIAFYEPKRWASKYNTQQRKEKLDSSMSMQIQFVRTAYKSGLMIVAGTDAPFLGYMQIGKSLIREMEMYYELGMPLFETLKTGTINAAKYLQLEDSIGTIEVGKSADLILLKSNPIESLNALYDVSNIFIRGKEYKK